MESRESREEAEARAQRLPPPVEIPKGEVVTPDALRRRRISYGWTLDDLAEITGESALLLEMLETGRLPSLPPDAWAVIVSALRLASSPSTVRPPLAVHPSPTARSRARTAARLYPPRLEGLQPPLSAPWWVRLKLQRLRLGLTIRGAAEWAGVGAAAVELFEAGGLPLSRGRREVLRDLASALRLDLPLPPIPTPLPGVWSLRKDRGAGVWAAFALTLPLGSPAQALVSARLRNGWSVTRTARAVGHSAHSVALAELAQTWPLRLSPVLHSLLGLWRASPPYSYSSSTPDRSPVAARLLAAMNSYGLSPADARLLCDVAPLAWDIVADPRRPDQSGQAWRVIGALAKELPLLDDGSTVPDRYRQTNQSKRKGA